jgi:DNA protecting protein DprA
MSRQRDEGGLPPGYDAETVAFLGISTLPGVGFRYLRRIGGRAGLRSLLENGDPRSFGSAIDLPWERLRQQIWDEGKRLAGRLSQQQVRLAFEGDKAYPTHLRALSEGTRPCWVFMRGNPEVLDTASVAVVGTREPSPEGIFIAQYAVTMAQALNVVVLSGLARGIDGTAHEWALRRGCATISVLGTGILRPYPSNHRDLGDRIVSSGGLLISEYLPDDGPQRDRFVARNRIQAALSHAVVAAEWGAISGTAHTVRYARELRRPVYGIRLAGQDNANGAGVPDREFVIPLDETQLYQSLQKATASGCLEGMDQSVQESLFDGENDAQVAHHQPR